MKFQDSSFNGLKVTVGTKSVTHPRTHPHTHAPKAICPINFFKVGGITRMKGWSLRLRPDCLGAQSDLTDHSLLFVYASIRFSHDTY